MERLQDYGICNYDIISENSRKGRYCLRFCNDAYNITSSWLNAPENEICLIKWNCIENEKHYKTLEKEMEIYECLATANITPKLYAKKPYFVMKYEKECRTFREYLLELNSSDELELMLRSVFSKYVNMLIVLNEQSRPDIGCLPSLEAQIKMFFSKLLFSGPEGTKENKVEKTINKLYKYSIGAINRIDESKFSTSNYAIHGDFHLNNQLVNAEGQVFLIDFENVVYGNPNVELAYWYVQAWILISMKGEYIQVLDREIALVLEQDYFDEKTFWMVVKWFKKAIGRNSRFQRMN